MKILCSKTNLLKGVQTVQNAVSTKAALPILSNILMETEENQLHLAATDLELGIECQIPVQVLEKGGIAVPARKIGDIVRELPDDEVSLVVKDNLMTINCQRGIFKIAGLGREDFPKLPQWEEKKSFNLKQNVLKEMFKKTSFAVSHDETRYALNGILFVIKNNKLKLVATDGRRLACIEKNVELPKELEEELIIPFKAINEVFRILDEGEGDLKIILGENQTSFCLAQVRIITRLIEGHFPNYQEVIPRKCKERVTLTKEPFFSALKRVAILTSERFNSVRLDIFKNRMLLTTTASEVGEAAKEEIDLNYEGEEVSVAFNPIYLLDFLKNEEKEKIYLELTDSLSPGLMRPALPDDKRASEEKYLYVIMPMKL